MSNFEKKRTVTVSFQLLHEDDCKGLHKFSKLVETVNSVWGKIPDEHKNNTSLERIIEEDYDGYNVLINCYYTREETDEEYKVRMENLKVAKEIQEEGERQTYLRLKKKYEGK